MADISVQDANGVTQTMRKPNPNGRATAANSAPTVLANEDLAAINAIATALGQTLTVDGAVTVSGVATAANQSTANTALAAIQTAVEGTVDVAATSLPLPTGAATETTLAAIETLLSGTITVDGDVTVSGVATAANQATANTTLAAIETATEAAQAALEGTLAISAASLPLPTGAATAANQATGNTALAAIQSAVEGTVTVDGSGVTQPVSVVGNDYETVVASATDQALGTTGAAGDRLDGLLIVPASTSPGAVSIKDGAGSAITVFTGGADSVGSLVPFFVPVGATSGAGAWQVTTGADVSVIASGNFT